MSFLVIVWTRVAAAARPPAASPLPVAAAAISGACIAVGSLLQALIAGGLIFDLLPELSPDIMRVLGGAAGPLILVGGMLALALAVASLALQARAAGASGTGMIIFSLAVAGITVFSFQFFPVLAPLVWAVTLSITLIRRPALARSWRAPRGPGRMGERTAWRRTATPPASRKAPRSSSPAPRESVRSSPVRASQGRHALSHQLRQSAQPRCTTGVTQDARRPDHLHWTTHT